MQVVTAVIDALSHGANEITNAMGPFEIIYVIYADSVVDTVGRPLGVGSGFL